MRKATLMLTALIAVGCGGDRPAASSAATAVTPASASTAPTVAAAAWPSGDPVPAELAGQWFLGAGNTRMRLSGNTYDIEGASGNVVVTRNEIAFFNGSGCGMPLPGGVGRYSWTLTGESVRFVPLGADPCGRAEVLVNATGTRARH